MATEKNLLFFDTETTGLIGRGHPDPHLVQLAWQVFSSDRHLIKEENFIVRPDGWTIPPVSAAIHGISTRRAEEHGRPLSEVWARFSADWNTSDLVVAHNLTFDLQVLFLAHQEMGAPRPFPVKPWLCTMQTAHVLNTTPFTQWPTLDKLHRFCFGETFEGQHDAMADIKATSRCFWFMVDKGWISI